MRLSDLINESVKGVEKIEPGQAAAIPNAFVIPKLHNTDPYIQYRMGMAMAAAPGQKDRDAEGSANGVGKESTWGQAFAIIDYSGTQEDQINSALQMVGLQPSDKKAITTKGSHEVKSVEKDSPVAKRKELWDLYRKQKITEGEILQFTGREIPPGTDDAKEVAAQLFALKDNDPQYADKRDQLLEQLRKLGFRLRADLKGFYIVNHKYNFKVLVHPTKV